MYERCQEIAADYGVKIVDPSVRRPQAFETRAGRTLHRILRKHGEDHLRDVLTTMTESNNNAHALYEPVLWAVSRLLLAHGRWYEADAGLWLQVFDRTNLRELYDITKTNRRCARPTDAIAHHMYLPLYAAFLPREQDRLPV